MSSANRLSGPRSIPRRRFEFRRGSSSKFWEVWTTDSSVHCRWGRTGTDEPAKITRERERRKRARKKKTSREFEFKRPRPKLIQEDQ